MTDNARISVNLLSSQIKIFPDTAPGEYPALLPEHGTCLSGEPFSFQIAVRTAGSSFHPVSAAVTSKLPVSVYKIGFVPLSTACNPNREEGYARSEGGLYPDVLLARPAVPKIVSYPNAWGGELYCEEDTQTTFNCTADVTQGLWVTLNEDSIPFSAGDYPVHIILTSLIDGTVLFETEYVVSVIGMTLPRVPAYYTNWFHCDCLADLYGVEVYSERFWEIFASFVSNAAKHRMNTLLLPAFTPPLDMPIGGTRKNVQLVGITVGQDGVYHFDFSKMRRYLDLARACGMTYFEHCHLFSQWGAEHAPLIYADVDGREALIFGWDTDAAGEEYRAFLAQYLTAFASFAREIGIWEQMVFHVSDEPSAAHEEHYRAAVEGVRPYLCGCIIADALSDYRYYERGLVSTPIASLDHVGTFAGRCDDLWVYYTGGPYMKNCSNRLISNTAARTRVLGVQMYALGAKGFLHWGYNYYYDRMSQGLFDPFADPCAYKQMPGSTYLVYPGRDGRAIPSIREKLMAEAFSDLGALQLLETQIGRDAVLALCRDVLGEEIAPTTIPDDNALAALRAAVNRALVQHV